MAETFRIVKRILTAGGLRRGLKKAACLAFAALAIALPLASCGVDPVVRHEENATSEYSVKISEEAEEKELPGFHSYASGRTDPVTVAGVEIRVTDFALRAYELAYMMAQPKFSSVDDIPIDPLVQFALAHVYCENLNETENQSMQYCDAGEDKIREQLMRFFGSNGFHVKDSVLYNAGRKIFEMWIPAYGCNIYYTVNEVDASDDRARISVTFFNELQRDTIRGKATIEVMIKDGKPVIGSLSAE